jgi:hypothetical protein
VLFKHNYKQFGIHHRACVKKLHSFVTMPEAT